MRRSFSLCWRKQVVSEERLSIRESLRIFTRVSESIPKGETFESLFVLPAAAHASSIVEEASCGLTMRCFASLFVAPHRVEKIIQGSDLSLLLGNPNVLLYAYRTHHHEQIRSFLSLSASTVEDKATYNQFARRFSRMSSRCGLSSLVGDLMRRDEETAFPRILFVSLVWVSQDDQKDDRQGEQGQQQQLYDLSDHKFTLIKHSNEHFQLLQGYIKGSGKESERLGLGLKSCQAKCESNAFASHAGFGRRVMKSFLSKLKHFVEDDVFCRNNYQALFGVDLLNEGSDRAYWPSVSHTELLDNNIKGGGERAVGDLLESRLFVVAT